MNIEALSRLLATIHSEATKAAIEATTIDALRSAESRIVKGQIADILKNIKNFPPDERGAAGQFINKTKREISDIFKAAQDKHRVAEV